MSNTGQTCGRGSTWSGLRLRLQPDAKPKAISPNVNLQVQAKVWMQMQVSWGWGRSSEYMCKNEGGATNHSLGVCTKLILFEVMPPVQNFLAIPNNMFPATSTWTLACSMDASPSQNQPNVPKTRCKYTYHIPLTILQVPQPPPLVDSPQYHLQTSPAIPTTLWPQTPEISPAVLQLIQDHAGARVTLSQSVSPTTPDSDTSLLEPFVHQQVKKVLSKFDHVNHVLESCQEHFETLADFLDALLENVHCDTPDTQTIWHRWMLRSFLQGSNAIKPLTIVEKFYNHYSYPSYCSKSIQEKSYAFDPSCYVQVQYWRSSADTLMLRFRRSTFGYPRDTRNGAPQSELGHWRPFNFFILSFIFTYLPDAPFWLSTTCIPHVLAYNILP